MASMTTNSGRDELIPRSGEASITPRPRYVCRLNTIFARSKEEERKTWAENHNGIDKEQNVMVAAQI